MHRSAKKISSAANCGVRDGLLCSLAPTTSTGPLPTAANSPTATEVESGGEVKMTKQEIIEMIHGAGFDPVERDTVYNRVEKAHV